MQPMPPRVSELLDLSNQAILVTGASGNIGAGIARRLHEAGASVALHCTSNRASLELFATQLGSRVAIVQGDVERDAERLCAEARSAFSGLTGLVNNAGIQPVRMLLEQISADRAEMLRFRGYRLDGKRFPSFKYEMGSVTVTESYQPAGSAATRDLRVTRTLYFLAPQPTSNLYVRAAIGDIKADGANGWTTTSGYRCTVEEGAGVLRESAGPNPAQELLIPVIFTGDTSTVAITYQWNP